MATLREFVFKIAILIRLMIEPKALFGMSNLFAQKLKNKINLFGIKVLFFIF